MILAAIVATANNGVIGKQGGLPWYLPADLAHFKNVTTGHPIIMGRTTHDSIGKALPNRQNIVITHNKDFQAEGCTVVNSLGAAVKAAGNNDQVFIIGGESIYEQALPQVQRIYLTEVDADIAGDKYFHYQPAQWREISREEHQADEKNPYSYAFVVLERRVR